MGFKLHRDASVLAYKRFYRQGTQLRGSIIVNQGLNVSAMHLVTLIKHFCVHKIAVSTQNHLPRFFGFRPNDFADFWLSRCVMLYSAFAHLICPLYAVATALLL